MEYSQLNNSLQMPKLGFGVFQIDDSTECERIVSDAISVGYRLFDTAAIYGNEEAVGRAIKKSGIDRDQFFVTSKLWIKDASYEAAKKAIDVSLQKLDMDYLDLYLIHQPYGDLFGAWKAMEEAYQAGKIKAIGVSNFYSDQVKNLELFNKVKPAVNQLEVNPWNQQLSEVDFNQNEDIHVEAWAPFAEGKHHIFTNQIIKDIGSKYNKSNGQIILRWLIQRGITVIPKSSHLERMKENFDVFDFELSTDDMKTITQLDKNESQFFDRRDPVSIEKIVNGERLGTN
ncbi:aldo/keto reductase [Companilactobacillus formosensis]|jgi:diketogulonate reductase-like aldo/keto reductase|uniref:aldo/keto reductase n=1 Tax=Companilactobacillus formosensis TaxID=1617889 RepID=UPI000E656E02|nr:aldo/keto reductase [Companilactobacillus formosensis]